jgi:acetylornithine deacetylase/succinyl-diaminopimelate desuccinylase-like protein
MSESLRRSLAVALALAVSGSATAAPLRQTVAGYVQAHQIELLREYVELLSLPNLASDGPGIRANADAIVRLLARRGVAARLLDGQGGPPVVYGELPAGASKTVVIYAHYDGQPVEPERWASPPWKPVLRDGPLRPGARTIELGSLIAPLDPEWRIFARSASDDKAPVLAIPAALDALSAVGAKPSVNLKLFFEGEEEAGSPHIAQVLAANRELLKADAWLLCDGPVNQSRRPQVVFGARGVTDVEVTLYGPSRAVHSGHYGNWAPNPAVALAELVAGLRDADGRIKIAGFYDDVRPVTSAEQAALAAVPDVDAALRQELSLAAGAQPARARGGRGRRQGAKRDPGRRARVDRLPPRTRPDAGEGPRALRGAPARAGLHDRPRGADARGAPRDAEAGAARVGTGLPRGTHGARPSVLAAAAGGRGRGAGGAGDRAAHARRQRADARLHRHLRRAGGAAADREPRQLAARVRREPAAPEPVGRDRHLLGRDRRPGRGLVSAPACERIGHSQRIPVGGG